MRNDSQSQLPSPPQAINRRILARALTFNDSPADAAEHEEQVLLQHHNVCFFGLVFFYSFSRCFLSAKCAGVRGASSFLQMTGLSGWVRTFFFKRGSTRTPRICRDAPGAERSGRCAVDGLQRHAPRHSDEQSAALATRAVSATAELISPAHSRVARLE